MATKTNRGCVLERACSDWRLLKRENFKTLIFKSKTQTSRMTSPRAMALDATRCRPLVFELRRVNGEQEDLCFDQWARW